MSEIYNGDSQGFDLMCDGYIDYAKEVISHRSVPDLRDGLKPIGRRCLYATSKLNNKSFSKSVTVLGEILKLHPHGDTSVYGSLCTIVDSNGTMNLPLFEGQGNFGRVYSSGSPAAPRYTKTKLNSYSELYLRDINAVEMVVSEEGDGFEPVVLPVRFPSALINGTSGMAVSVATAIPSFNLNDVIEITQDIIKTGEPSRNIVPDFPTGGILVSDESELAKIMLTGKGRLKIRAKVEIEGKVILVKEVPFGKTVENIIKNIDKAEISGIQSAFDASGSTSDTLLKITCKTQKVVDQVLLALYKHRILQTSFSSNMLFIKDKEPLYLGVKDTILHWLDWRRSVVKLKFEKLIDSLKEEEERLVYFTQLVRNLEWRDTYTDTVVKNGKKAGSTYLKGIFPDIDDSNCEWIADRNIASFNKGERYETRLATLLETKSEYQNVLKDIDTYILNDLEEVKNECRGVSARRTEVTYYDYKFTTNREKEPEDDSFCVYTVYKDGFLTKTRSGDNIDNKEVLTEIHAQANSILIGFDCFGRVLRVYGTDIPFTQKGSNGVYLNNYFEVPEDEEDYSIPYMSLLDGTKKMIVYKDGYAGFLDTSEWLDKTKKSKTLLNGVCRHVFDKLLEVYEEDEIPEYMLFVDDTQPKGVKLGLVKSSGIKEVGRITRTRILPGRDIETKYIKPLSSKEAFYGDLNIADLLDKFKYVDLDKVGLRRADEGRYLVD
jgi:DNA gyrase subunit A